MFQCFQHPLVDAEAFPAGPVGVRHLGLILVDLERIFAVLRAEHQAIVGGGSGRRSQRVVERADAASERLEVLRLVVERAELDRYAVAEQFREVEYIDRGTPKSQAFHVSPAVPDR